MITCTEKQLLAAWDRATKAFKAGRHASWMDEEILKSNYLMLPDMEAKGLSQEVLDLFTYMLRHVSPMGERFLRERR